MDASLFLHSLKYFYNNMISFYCGLNFSLSITVLLFCMPLFVIHEYLYELQSLPFLASFMIVTFSSSLNSHALVCSIFVTFISKFNKFILLSRVSN